MPQASYHLGRVCVHMTMSVNSLVWINSVNDMKSKKIAFINFKNINYIELYSTKILKINQKHVESDPWNAREGERKVIIVCNTHIDYWLKSMNFVHVIIIFAIQEMSICTHNWNRGRTELSFVIYQSILTELSFVNFTRDISPYVFKVWRFRGAVRLRLPIDLIC